jgi:hypothetical protein
MLQPFVLAIFFLTFMSAVPDELLSMIVTRLGRANLYMMLFYILSYTISPSHQHHYNT